MRGDTNLSLEGVPVILHLFLVTADHELTHRKRKNKTN